MKLNKNVGVPLPIRFSVWFASDTNEDRPLQIGLLRRTLIFHSYENKGSVFVRNFKNLLSSYGAPLVNEEDVTTILTVTQLKIISLCCITESSRLKLINLNTGESFVGSNAIEEALKSGETSK